MQLHRLVDGLGAKRNGASWMAPCPAHHDPNPSLAIKGENGSVLVHCHAGCPQSAVIEALKGKGLWENAEAMESPADVFEADYTYRDASGKALAIKSRYRTTVGKRFTWRLADHENCKGLREHDLRVEDMPLYGIEHMEKAKAQGFAVLVEGEKAAQACWRANLIAFCNPGGSGQRDFGASLDTLKGMDVVLWPDNDDPGRALMRAIKDKLSGIAASVRTVAPEVPEKGDAADYFLTQTKQDFVGLLDKLQDKPWVEQTVDGYLVSIPESGGFVRFEFVNLERHNCEAAVWLEVPGHPSERFETPLNFMSVSGREAFRRQLEDSLPLGKGVWGKLVSKAIGLCRGAVKDHDPSIELCQVAVPSGETAYLLKPWLLTDGPTILFGAGGSAKTYLALTWAVCLATGAPFLAEEPLERVRVLYVDYEATAERLRMRLRNIQNGLGIGTEQVSGIFYWPGSAPLAEMVPALRRKVKRERIGLVIVDSLLLAAGGSPKEAEIATGYFNALRQLEVPSLSIGHVVKDEEGDKYPFGVIVYHNSARLTWNVKRQQEEGENVVHVGLFNRKANDDKQMPSVGLRLEFEDEAFYCQREDVRAHFVKSTGAKTQILAALRRPMCAVCLSSETGIGRDTVRSRLSDLKNNGQVVALAENCLEHKTSKWGVRSNYE